MRWVDAFLKMTGAVPLGMHFAQLEESVYLYDPENLPGSHQVINPWQESATGGIEASTRMLVQWFSLTIDDADYFVPYSYIDEADFQVVPGMTPEDL